ncbi:MAG: hypothetical protein ABI700_12960 [Chloroflexota bacterium]
MDFSNAPADFLINIVAGIVGALIILIVVDSRRRPNLKITKRDPHISPGNGVFLRVFVDNTPMQKLFRFLNREPAYATRAWISFYYPDTTPVYQEEMIGRWSETPAPQEQYREIQTPEGKVNIVSIPESRNWEDIPPEEGRHLDICVKNNNESGCYGWNNQDYAIPNKWKFVSGRYFVKVRIKTSGQEFVEVFQLLNDNDFRLEKANITELKNQYAKLKKWSL